MKEEKDIKDMAGCSFVPKITKYKKKKDREFSAAPPGYNQSSVESMRQANIEEAIIAARKKASTQSVGVFDKLSQ